MWLLLRAPHKKDEVKVCLKDIFEPLKYKFPKQHLLLFRDIHSEYLNSGIFNHRDFKKTTQLQFRGFKADCG